MSAFGHHNTVVVFPHVPGRILAGQGVGLSWVATLDPVLLDLFSIVPPFAGPKPFPLGSLYRVP